MCYYIKFMTQIVSMHMQAKLKISNAIITIKLYIILKPAVLIINIVNWDWNDNKEIMAMKCYNEIKLVNDKTSTRFINRSSALYDVSYSRKWSTSEHTLLWIRTAIPSWHDALSVTKIRFYYAILHNRTMCMLKSIQSR